MRQHDTTIACAVDIRIDEAAILSGKRDVVLSGGENRKGHGGPNER
jgi:hypothetical protein